MIDRKTQSHTVTKPAQNRRWLWVIITFLILMTAAGGGWYWRFRTYTPVAVMQDIRAAIKVRHAAQPAVAFLEARYGPLTLPENRQKAFIDFFNVDHMEGLYRITSKMQGAQKVTNIAATAQWIAGYRGGMTPEEKAGLAAYLRSEAGRQTLARATVEYLRRDVEYRSATAPVIAELMKTLSVVQTP